MPLTIMWIEKSPRELAGELRARRLAASLCGLALACLLCVAVIPHPGFSVSNGVQIGAALAAGVLLLAWGRRARCRRIRSSVRICQKCNMVKVDENQETCVCGGGLRPLCEMKWLDSPSSKADPPPGPSAENAISAAPPDLSRAAAIHPGSSYSS